MKRLVVIFIVLQIAVFLFGGFFFGALARFLTAPVATVTVVETTTRPEPTVLTTTALAVIQHTEVRTKTVTETVTIGATTVYPAVDGVVLLSDSGVGDKDLPPFTLDRASDIKIKVKIYAKASLEYVGFSWFLYRVGSQAYLEEGHIDYAEGEFEFYVAAVPAGNWYLSILTANCSWEVTVERVT